jgi:hypothetical protein
MRVALALGVVVLAGPAAASGNGGLRTALIDFNIPADESELGFRRMTAAGATAVRLTLSWQSVAPSVRSTTFNPADPLDPAYRWDALDAKLRSLRQSGLEPILSLHGAPAWARRDPARTESAPVAADLRLFMRAAATRYNGRNRGLPHVRYWQLWIEPNVNLFFLPQHEGGRRASPLVYRELLNAFAPAVRHANPKARVIAGGLSPFGKRGDYLTVIPPLAFMRDLLCVSAGRSPRKTCSARVPFDIWSHHPYTAGGPTRKAYRADDVSIGDLPAMRRVLEAARRFGNVNARGPVDFWVTEFSWDSSPPDPKGVPAALHARWTAEALYRMWTSGVSLVTWLALRDFPYPAQPIQAGLWYRGATLRADRPKPALQAFRFPVVAFDQRGRIFVWGRTPAGKPGRVVVERSFRGGWTRLGTFRTNRHGIFTARVRGPSARGWVRARFVATGERSRPFSLRDPGDRVYQPFG